jgi:DNA replication protein DnaC
VLDIDVSTFYKNILPGIQGIACMATKHKTTKEFARYFYEWPEQLDVLAEHTVKASVNHDVYFMPALLKDKTNARKDNVLAAKSFWVEADTAVLETTAIPLPNIVVNTSPGKTHLYWLTDICYDLAVIEDNNKKLMFLLGVNSADDSGWDVTQLLRPIMTYNYKYEAPIQVDVSRFDTTSLAIDLFNALPQTLTEPYTEAYTIENVPALEDIVFKYALPSIATNIFKTGISTSIKQDGSGNVDKSDTLMQLAYECAKSAVSPEDIMSILLHLDARIKKFDGRQDQKKHLSAIVKTAITKYPSTGNYKMPSIADLCINFEELLNIERSVEWVMEGFIEKNGNAMLTGPPGIGKSTLTMNAAAHIAMGKEFLGFQVEKPRKILFVSLEMSDMDLKVFALKQVKAYTPDEQKLLRDNFHVLPLGSPYFLNYKAQQNALVEMLEKSSIDGIFVDSLSRAIDKPLQDESATRDLMGWVDSMRSSKNFFFWWLHHNRKASGDNKKPNTLADVYGSVFITTALTACASLWPTKTDNTLEVSFIKTRLSSTPEPFDIKRSTDSLTFNKVLGKVNIKQEKENALASFEAFTNVNAKRSNGPQI